MITSNEWKIHRKLEEVNTVYIWPARGHDKLFTQLELYAELLSSNKRIVAMLDEGYDYFVPNKDYGDFYSRFKISILD